LKAAAHGAGAERFAAAGGSSNCYGEQLLTGAVLFQAGKKQGKRLMQSLLGGNIYGSVHLPLQAT